MPTSTSTPPPLPAQAVLEWRAGQLAAAGYSPEHIAQLAERADIDLHLATAHLRKGCSLATALRILV